MPHQRGGHASHHYDPVTGYTIIDVQETEEGPAPGTAIKPIPEVYAGRNFPYRGTETHGVDPIYDTPPTPESWEGGMATVDTEKLEQEAEKVVPIRIVAESTREHETWSAQQLWVGSRPIQLVGRNTRRTSLKLKNLSDTVVLYVAPNEMSCKHYLGYPVDPNEDFSLAGSDQIWGVSATGDDILIAVFMEYTTGG